MMRAAQKAAGEWLLAQLWEQFLGDVPYAREYVRIAGNTFQNDHVAFRSLRQPGGGIEQMSSVFERFGWRTVGHYRFPDVHLDAVHLSHPAGLPRVFISQLRVQELSAPTQALLARLLPTQAPRDLEEMPAWFAAPPPGAEADLLTLEGESQYAAWYWLFGRKVNHFTAAVKDIDQWQARLRAAGVPMKAVIEGQRGSLLRQTATVAAPARILFSDGREGEWPYGYLELAERHPAFDGFFVDQGRPLIEMTRRPAGSQRLVR
jgi:hypothetical protein